MKVAPHWALLPAWAVYVLALFEFTPGGWFDRAGLILAMQVEWMAVVTVPMLAGLAASRAGPLALRVIVVMTAAAALTYALHEALGPAAVAAYWLGGCLTYLGWVFEADAPEWVKALLVRWLVAMVALIPVFFAVVVVAQLTRLEPALLLGAAYFLLLEILEFSGAYGRALEWYRTAERGRNRPLA